MMDSRAPVGPRPPEAVALDPIYKVLGTPLA